MDGSIEGEFYLRDFSPQSLTFIPGLNCVLASNGRGETRCIDVVTGDVQQSLDISLPASSGNFPVLVNLHPSSQKVVVAASNHVGARSVHKGCVLLKTILQPPARKKDDKVSIEIPTEQVPSFLKELQKSVSRSSTNRDIATQLYNKQHGPKFSTASFSGNVSKMADTLNEVLVRLKSASPGGNGTSTGSSGSQVSRALTMPPTLLPLISSLAFRLYLLQPEHHAKIQRLERGELTIGMAENKLMNIEALRKLSLADWPHDYEWATPKTMAEAGFYHLVGPQGNVSKGDRVTCFSCRVYLYSWEPTDEPWSEHERHAVQCPYIRGEYTDNVPLEETEASCPAYHCLQQGVEGGEGLLQGEKREGEGKGEEDQIVCLGTSLGTELVAVGTECGRVILLDTENGLLIMERARVDITQQFQGEWVPKVRSSFCTGFPPTSKGPQPQASQPDSTSASKGKSTSGSLTELLSNLAGTQENLEAKVTSDTSEPEGSKVPPGTAEEKSRTTSDSGEGQKEAGNQLETSGGGSHPESKDQAEVKHGAERETIEDSGQPSDGAETSKGDNLAKEVDGESQSKTMEISDAATKDQGDLQVVPNLDSSEKSTEEPKDVPLPLSGGAEETAAGTNSSNPPPSFRITALAVFTRQKDPSSTTSTSSSSTTTTTTTTSGSAPFDSKAPPCSVVVTGFTAANLFSHRLVPMLLVHHVRTKNRYSSGKPKPGSIPAGVLPMGAQGGGDFYMDILDPVPNPIHLSSSVCESESLAVVDPIGAIELEEYAAEDESRGWPQIGQILPLDGGKLLVVTCISAATADKSMQTSILLFSVDPTLKINRELFFHDTIKSARFHICPLKESSDKVLLAGVSMDGRVIIFDCSAGKLNRVCEFSCFPPDSTAEATGCTYCPTTARLLVSLKKGKVLSLKIEDKEIVRTHLGTESAGMESGLERNLDSRDFDNILDLVGVSSVGVPFTCSSHVHWKEISLLQLNRRSPLHMNMGPEAAEGRHTPPNLPRRQRGNMDNSKILQYEPPLEQPMSGRYTFELVIASPESVQIGCLNVKLSFANTQCIGTDATISLSLPSRESNSLGLRGQMGYSGRVHTSVLDQENLLCGPIRLKPLVNVTEQSLQVFLCHPALLQAQVRVLLLTIDNLFSSKYKEVSFVETPGPNSMDAASKRQAWRNRAFRHQVLSQSSQSDLNKLSVPVKANLRVSIHPLSASPSLLKQLPLTFSQLIPAIHDPVFALRVTLAACAGRVEASEAGRLPQPLQDGIKLLSCSKETQRKALDVLLWMGQVHSTGAKTGEYAVFAFAVGQLLLSLLYACFVEGDRMLSHKCSQLILMLYKFESDSDMTDQFNFTLSETLTRLLPLLPSFSFASCVHWFLRLVSTLSRSCDFPGISRICRGLLVGLSKALSTRTSLPAQILQTNFKHEGSVFEPELFDIYLSYCQKSSSVITKSAKSTSLYPGAPASIAGGLSTSASSTDLLSYATQTLESFYLPSGPNPSDIYSLPSSTAPQPVWGKMPSSTVSSVGGGGIPAGTTHVVTDKGGHTIYDSELKLLLDSKKTESEGRKFIEDFTTYKHGSFLLFSQRGLLETLPLTYVCLSVTGNATIIEPNIHTLPHVTDHQPLQTQASVISKTSGYNYPSASVGTSQHKRAKGVSAPTTQSPDSAHPIPQILTDISTTPKELMMQVDSLKSGVAYSAHLKFPHPVSLTDISIPATGSMSSVSVDVWLEKDGEKDCIRVAQSSEIKTRSLMLGNLTPPPVCQYVKVTFLGSLTNTREMTQVFIGAFYGIPIFPPELAPSTAQLHSLEDRLLSQYYLHRDSLVSALLSYASLHPSAPNMPLHEEKVKQEYQQCFKMQVSLARLRNFIKHKTESDKSPGSNHGRVFEIPAESTTPLSQCSISKLNKLVGCLVDTLLIINSNTRRSFPSPGPEEVGLASGGDSVDEAVEFDESPFGEVDLLSEEECRVLFYTLCIHGIPKMHARATALLIKYGGSQRWWGSFVVSVTASLFDGQQAAVFNKERALLQLSALCQHTYTNSDLLQCMLTSLHHSLTYFINSAPSSSSTVPPSSTSQGTPSFSTSSSSEPPNHTVLRWTVMLLSHFLSSVVSTSSQSNLFTPLPMNPPSSHPKDGVREDPKKEREERHKEAVIEMQKEMRKVLSRVHTSMAGSEVDKMMVKQQLESKLLEYRSIRDRMVAQREAMESGGSGASSAAEVVKVAVKSGSDFLLELLPQELCRDVVKGLLKYVLALCKSESDNDFIPVVCKCVCLLVSSTKWCYPLHTLLAQEELNQLLLHSTSSLSPTSTPTDYTSGLVTSFEWRRRTLQNLCFCILHYGEVKPCLEVAKAGVKEEDHPLPPPPPPPPAPPAAASHPPDRVARIRKVKVRTSSLNRVPSKKKIEKLSKKAAPATTASKIGNVHYNTFIISNTIETRRALMPDVVPELQLQKIAKGMYGSILLSLLNAKPLLTQSPLGEKLEEDVDFFLLESPKECWVFPKTVSMLVHSLEQLLKRASGCHQILSDVDIMMILSLWHEMNDILVAPRSQVPALRHTNDPHQVTSEDCCSLLVSYLLNQSTIPPTLWQSSITNLTTSLQYQRNLFTDYDKLLAVFVKFFVSSNSHMVSLVPSVVSTLLSDRANLASGKHKQELSGNCLLLEILITAIKKRSTNSSGDYSLLCELTKSLTESQSDDCFGPGIVFPARMFDLMQTFCYLVVDLLPEAFNENAFPGVEVYGSEFDDARRKHYASTLTDLHKRTWVPANSETPRITQLLVHLLQLLTSVFSQECALTTPSPLPECFQEYCVKKFGGGGGAISQVEESKEEVKEGDFDYLKLAHPQCQCLSLVYADSELLFQFLWLLNLLTARKQRSSTVEILICEAFVLFLYNNCQDVSCFFKPIQRVLDTSTAGSRFSKLFISLITRAPAYQCEGRYKAHDAAEFIQCGGGVMVLKSLIASSKQAASLSGSKEFSIHAINKLGQKDSPQKPINDSSQLIDFFPTSMPYLQSSKGTTKVSQSSRSFTVFHHTYTPNEKWIQLHILFNHPILLHNFICCLVATEGTNSTAHGSPSKMFIESSVHGGLHSDIPITPVCITDSLKFVNVAFHAPVLTQHLSVHFHLPLLSRTVVVSRVEVLGTSYGTVAKAIAPVAGGKAESQSKQEIPHQGAGWIDIVDQWLNSSPEAVQALKSLFVELPDLLPSCLSLLTTVGRQTNKKFVSQLENLLAAIAEAIPEHGLAILHDLLGFRVGSGIRVDEYLRVPFSLRLFFRICEPVTDVNKDRLTIALKLLSYYPPGGPPLAKQVAPVVYAISNIIWYCRDVEDLCPEETFRTLVNLAFSVECDTLFKMSMNALLCSLCSVNPAFFSLMLTSCHEVLTCRVNNLGARLDALARAAQSFHCTKILLSSDLMAGIISRLTTGFDLLLEFALRSKQEEPTFDEDVRDIAHRLCYFVAFLSDFFRNWRPGKEWMATTDSHRFWFPMIQFLSIDSLILAPLEMAFVKEVVFEFFGVCLSQCDQTRRLFIQILSDNLNNPRFWFNGPEPSNTPVLTTFLHKILVDIVFQEESIPVILKIMPSCELSQYPSSFSTTHEVLDFHPSYPVERMCYYLQVPGTYSLAQLEALVKSCIFSKPYLTPRQEARRAEKALNKKPSTLSASAKSMAGVKSSLSKSSSQQQSAESSACNVDVVNFKFQEWLLPSEGNAIAGEKEKASFSYYQLDCEGMEGNKHIAYRDFIKVFKEKGPGARMSESENVTIADMVPFGYNYPLVVIMDEKLFSFAIEKQGKRDLDMYNMFASCRGLIPLAQSIPPLYPYLWPSSFAAASSQLSQISTQPQIGKSRQLLTPHIILAPPTITPFRSVVMFGVGLQLEEFGKMVGENPAIARLMMKLLLGEDINVKDSIPKAFAESLSYLPYLVAMETLRKSPACTEAGRTLRLKAQEVGLLNLVLQCLSLASHHSPRVEGEGPNATGTSGGAIPLEDIKSSQPKKISSSVDKQYWAKGTGFGTGSTVSSYNMIAVRAKHKSEEKYVSICFAILSEFLGGHEGVGKKDSRKEEEKTEVDGEGKGAEDVAEGEKKEEEGSVFLASPTADSDVDFCTVEVIELLCKSCMLPALASYLLNDSVLDICKHIELYQSTLNLVSAIASNLATQHLLTLPVFSADGEQSSNGGVTSLSSLVAKLREIAIVYQKTAKLQQPKSTSQKETKPLLRKRNGSTPPSPSTVSKAKNEQSSKDKVTSSQTAKVSELEKDSVKEEANLDALQLAASYLSSGASSSTSSTGSTTISATVDALLPLPPLSMHPIPMPPPPVVQLPIEGASAALHDLNSILNPQIVQMFGQLPPGELPMPVSQASFHPVPILSPYQPPPPTIPPPVLLPQQFVSSSIHLPSLLENMPQVYDVLVEGLQVQQPALATPQYSPQLMPMQVPPPPRAVQPVMPRVPAPRMAAPKLLPHQSGKEKPGKAANVSIVQPAASIVSAATEKIESSDTEAKLEPSESSSESAESKGFGSDKESLDATVTMQLEPIDLLKEQIVGESEHSGTDNQDSDAAEVSSKPASKSANLGTSSHHSTSKPLPIKWPRASKKSLSAHKPEKPPRSATKVSSDEADLVELVNKIISVSEQVACVVRALKKEAGSYSRQASISTPLTETPQEAAFAYEKAMKPLQFDTYAFTYEDDMGKVGFTCPFYYQNQVQSAVAAASVQDAARARRLAQEISSLSTSLPISPSSTVFVRCDEDRLDVMKVLITGPSDTPYANGCFEFDVFFPMDYPKSPMLVNLKTTGHGRVRFNPNLYNDGKVCLSVLNTWHGRPEEKWNGQTSSLLQVLVSIQSLILVPEPYFNEPGYEQSRGTPYGDQKSLAYSSNISVATIQWAMINQIRNPTPCFKQVILQHFFLRKESIISQYEAWKQELEEAIAKAKPGDTTVHLLREHLHSMAKSMDTLKVELDKLKETDFQPAPSKLGEGKGEKGSGDQGQGKQN